MVEKGQEKEREAEAVSSVPFAPPVGMAAVRIRYGSFGFQEQSGGNVHIDGSWPSDNLVIIRNIAGTGLSLQIHHLLVGHVIETITEARAAAPDYPIRLLGGFCARHKNHDPSEELSIHSWGAALDINWDKNPMTKMVLVSDMPEAFVQAFRNRGWNWGGDWHSSKDAMHFQYATGV